MANKKLIVPSDEDVNLYSNNFKKIVNLPEDPFKNFMISQANENFKNKSKFCSTIKVFLNWKDMVKKVLNSTEYKNDKK